MEHYNVAVLGAGPGGYVAALKAAQMGAKVAVIEKHHLGGTCLNYGCIPSKALLASAELLHKIEHAASLGVGVSGKASFDWAAIQKRKDKVLAGLRGGIGGLFKARKVTLYNGTGVLDGQGKIKIATDSGDEQISADNIILAVGSVPVRIPTWPSDPNLVCTSDEALHWDELPKRLLIVGGGVIGCEFACMMHAYGVEVSVVEMLPGLLPEMEADLGMGLAKDFTKRGIAIHVDTKVEGIVEAGGALTATLSGGVSLDVDKVLVAVGRRPATADIGLETIGIETDRGFVRVNDRMETGVTGVYCIGDANGRCLLAHAASAQGIAAVENALGHTKDLTAPIPGAVYTFPEIGGVGLTTQQAHDQNIPIAVGNFPLAFLGKAMAVGETDGFVKVIKHRETGELLGVHMLGHNATECIAAAGAMLHQKASVEDLAEVVFAHPTISEAIKESAEDALGMALHLPPRKIHRVKAGQ
ncbi:MAG: dihydrolipoyl dehydrogenase [Phycisphaerae bacterium]|nr:dihydrolipoyl dehydrogenase [Phycisphaerae bacterium]